MTRVLSWFSCGASSAITAKLITEKYGRQAQVLYCDTFAYEHPDNRRFFTDVERWLRRKIRVIHSEKYRDIYDVFIRERWLSGPKGARCTTEMKKIPRTLYQRPEDIHAFGFTAEEGRRVDVFHENNPELLAEFPLYEAGITKDECYERLRAAKIEIPMMYKLGYRNNNCIGCVKGGMGYWNKIRVDFPATFARMAKLERELKSANCRRRVPGTKARVNVFLDELPPDAGHYGSEPDIECGILCQVEDPNRGV